MTWLFTAFSGLGGCASLPANAPGFVQATDAPDGYATVYFYRIGAYPKLRRPTVFVDEAVVYDPPERALTWVYVRSGNHQLRVHWTWDSGPPDVSFPQAFVSGQSYYLRISGSYDLHITPGIKWATATGHFGTFFYPIPREEAENELKTCCQFVEPKVRRID
jgi:hypothetical protein